MNFAPWFWFQIIKFKNQLSETGSYKNEIGQNNMQKIWLLIFTLKDKKENKRIWNVNTYICGVT